MTNDEIQAIATVAAKTATAQISNILDEKLTHLSAANEKFLKTKFELVLDIDCTDENARAKSREAFRWLVANHAAIEEPMDWLVEFHGNRKSAVNRAINWVMTGLAVVAFYLAMLGFNIKHN